MTLSLIITFVGLLVWLIFTKWQKVADAWVAKVGEWSFVVGLSAYLFAVGVQTVSDIVSRP